MNELLRHLWQARGGQGSFDPTTGVKIDDRDDDDVALEFCTITATAEDQPDEFCLLLYPAPLNQELADHLQHLDVDITTLPLGPRLAIRVDNDDVRAIRELAKAIRKLTGRGKSYANANWKWICRRTADALQRLARMMREFQRAKRSGQLNSTEEDEGLFALSDE